MNHNIQGVSRNGNQGGSGQAGLEPTTGSRSLGNVCENTQALGAGATPSARPRTQGTPRDPEASIAGTAEALTGLEDYDLETVTYAGRTFEAGVVSEINIVTGGREVRHNKDRSGDEQLLRDAAGRYYLMRETFTAHVGVYNARRNPAATAYRRHLHRVSVVAAILYTTHNMGNGYPWDLRCDASNLLTGASLDVPDRSGRKTTANDYGVSVATLDAATRYAAKAGRTVDEMISDLLESVAGDGKEPEAMPPTSFRLDDHAGAKLRELAPVAPVLSVQLDAEATKLLTRYLEETPWNLAAQDVVSGCVCDHLEMAFSNKEEAEERTGLASDEYHDGEWGIVQASTDDAMERRTGRRSELKDPKDGRTVGTKMVRVELGVSEHGDEDESEEDGEDSQGDVDAAVAHMHRVLDAPAATGQLDDGKEVKERFLNGELRVPTDPATVEARCGL